MLPQADPMPGLARRPPRPYAKRSATIANLPQMSSPRRTLVPKFTPSSQSNAIQNGPSLPPRSRTPQRYPPPRSSPGGGRWASPGPDRHLSTPPPYTERARSATPSAMSGYSGDGVRGYSPVLGRPFPLSRNSSTESFSRRVFPQAGAMAGEVAGVARDEPVVFDAAMSFLLGRTSPTPGRGSIPVRQAVRPTPSHRMADTVSSALSDKISDFLKRTDHVMDEWKRLGRVDPDEAGMEGSLGRSRSAANIAIKSHLRYGSECRSVRSTRSMSRTSMVSSDDCLSMSELEEVEEEAEDVEAPDLPLECTAEALTEMTADLAEEHSTSTLAAERLEAEAAERIRLEKELQDSQGKNKLLQQSSERLEMELLFSRAAGMNGDVGGGGRGIGDDDEDVDDMDSGAALIYKQRYERAARELEFAKRRLQQQHEDDLEQLVGLKKQLEKKLTDAYEEVEEQRQVVGQWKRKSQKLTGEVNDLRLLLEEQNSRNVLLEKKQRKFDSELQQLQRELQQEKQNRERTAREKEAAQAELYSLEQSMSAMKLELELKEEKLTALTRELDELTFGGKTEEEVANLKKAKHELELKVKDQEEELDDLAGQVQLLEQAKLRLEMSLEQQRKEARREAAQRDEELEEARCNAHKKVKALEAQLEAEHEERTRLLRERHELERRLVEEGRGANGDGRRGGGADAEETIQRLRRDLRRTKALLRDAHTLLERSKGEPTAGKALLRSLRNQLEDAEAARQIAQKARQSAEEEAREAATALEEALRQRSEAEEKAAALGRERADLRAQLEENEEEMAEMLKKYKGAVQQVSEEQAAMAEQAGQLSTLEAERATLREQVAELWARLEAAMEGGGRTDPGASLAQRRLALKARDLESRLELEQTTRSRMEVQITRLKEGAEKATIEANAARARELAAQEALRRAQWAAREAREEAATAAARESEAAAKKREAEQRATVAEAESATTRADLRLALARLGDLQAAMRGEMGSGSSGGEDDETESDSDTSEDMVDALLSNHRRSSNMGVKSKGTPSHVSLESDYGSYGVADGSLGSTRSPAEGAPSKESSA
ncbi:unconventional myosin-XVIIIa isoform X3 [Hetaerina americana]|uniref:unconventional myosin-XVIIIa isoform X3 n=1 Tax=Hetaerina americana TaxID=62018 RepID=UPI003A7F54A1